MGIEEEYIYIAASSANGTQQTINSTNYSASFWNEVQDRGKVGAIHELPLQRVLLHKSY